METYINKTQEQKNSPAAEELSHNDAGNAPVIIDNRPEAIAQRKMQQAIDNSPRIQQFKTYQLMADNHAALITQRKEITGNSAQLQEKPAEGNRTGLPDQLKAGVESLSGISLDNVKVHYNSPQPAQLNAHAYARGTDIHVASGQEKHLPHEAWHVVQQAQGRVKPTMQMKTGTPVNDDEGLEREADLMGEKAANLVVEGKANISSLTNTYAAPAQFAPVQRAISVQDIDYNPGRPAHFRQGHIDQPNFYLALRNVLNAAPFLPGHRNIRVAVCTVVAQNDFNHPDMDTLVAAIAAAVTAEYNGQGRPIPGAALQAALATGIRAALVANIQANPAVDMNAAEAGGFDELAGRPNVVMSSAKGVASTIDHGDLPAAVQGGVNARLAELQAERNALTAAGLKLEEYFPTWFSGNVNTRQRALHYQGNHTNNAGWLPAVAAPIDQVSASADALLAAAGPQLTAYLTSGTGPTQLASGTADAAIRRREFRFLRGQHFQLTDAIVRDSALAALCNGVSGYIEFSLPGPISRMMYDAVNHRVYVTAHYKWREGFNPFFEVLNFPAL